MATAEHCSTCSVAPVELSVPAGRRSPPGWSSPVRAAFLFTGIFLPIACFAVGFDWPGNHPSKRHRSTEVYAQLLLCDKPPAAMYPVLAYSMLCMALLAFSPRRFVERFAVRLGIYTGLLLAVQYWVIFLLAFGMRARIPKDVLAMLLETAAAIGIPWLLGWLVVRLYRRYGPVVFAAVAALLYGGIVALPSDAAWFLLLVVSPIGWLLCATPWAMASYAAMTVYAARHERPQRLQFSLAQLLGVVTWVAVYLAAWRASITWMLADYAKLPEWADEGLARLFSGCGC